MSKLYLVSFLTVMKENIIKALYVGSVFQKNFPFTKSPKTSTLLLPPNYMYKEKSLLWRGQHIYRKLFYTEQVYTIIIEIQEKNNYDEKIFGRLTKIEKTYSHFFFMICVS